MVELHELTGRPLEHEHSPAAIQRRLEQGPRLSYLRDWIYGGIDGAVTTFAVVSGVVGANLPSSVIIILGVANLFADGFSMAASNFTATKTEHHELERARTIEERHIRIDPKGEIEEVRQIFMNKGFEGEDLDAIVRGIVSNEKLWVDTMLTEEYGLPLEVRTPILSAVSTFAAFQICGLIPLLPFLAGTGNPFALAAIFTGLTFFGIGSAKSRWSIIPWWKSGLETFVIGAAAAVLAFGVGYILQGLAG